LCVCITVVVEEKKTGVSFWVGVGLLCGLMLILIGAAVGFGSYKIWLRRRGVRRILEEEGGKKKREKRKKKKEKKKKKMVSAYVA